ncbi:unnamed protein product [Orchesella dallaii]|uniref:Uncharacterized protein n=1 Tax=Orchesella dallaii TaxID=48710 RepID=A0ABP1RGM0_9HEXA
MILLSKSLCSKRLLAYRQAIRSDFMHTAESNDNENMNFYKNTIRDVMLQAIFLLATDIVMDTHKRKAWTNDGYAAVQDYQIEGG